MPADATGLVWFRRDLRLDDNPAWAEATTAHETVCALFVLDPALFESAAPVRRRQLLANLRALDTRLAVNGGRLAVHRGDPADVVPRMARAIDAHTVYWNADVSSASAARDRRVTAGLTAPVVIRHGTLVLPPGTVRTADGSQVPRVFSAFHRRWAAVEWDPWAPPGGASIHDDPGDGVPESDGPPLLEGGEDAALARLAAFLERVDGYADRRDAIDDDTGTSGLSIDLKWGTLSPRQAAEAVGGGTPGREAFVRQLCWRDWYAHLLVEVPTLPTRSMRPEYDRIRWRNDPDEIDAWRTGSTGYPIVDAGMRELAQTGRMHNRLRLIVGSFLVKDLLVDWRIGEQHFRHLLADGDVSQNVGNWQWVAGTGPDAAPYFRVFNPVTQSRKFDPRGNYLRRWVPEVAALDDRAVHAPWDAGPLELAAAGVALGETYPAPVVDHAQARDRALAAYQAARGS